MPRWHELTRKDWNELARIVVSLIVLVTAVIIILENRYPGDDVKWAFGAIGMVFGYWCK